ncbi:hypothetical protein ACLB2K_006613 [Fragaria x ananassa]
MRRASIKTCHAYEYMVDVLGGYANVGFTLKDLYNKLEVKLDKLEVMGNKLDLLTTKIMKDRPRKLQNIGPFIGCRNLYDDDKYLIAFVFLELDEDELTFIVFETDYHHLDRSGMKCLQPGELVTSSIFVPILDLDTMPNHWFFIVIKMREMEVEIWDTCPSPSHTTPRDDLEFQNAGGVAIQDAPPEHRVLSVTPSTIKKRPCAPPSVLKVHKILLEVVNQPDEGEFVTPQKKLLNSIDKVEKVVMEELQRLKRTPSAKKAERERKFPIAFGLFGYEAIKLYKDYKKRVSTGNLESICEASIAWTRMNVAFCAFCGVLGGTVGGLLGSGGGFILSPLLLE